MRLLICGDRDWTDRSLVQYVIQEYMTPNDYLVIVHGGARGADLAGGEAAKRLGLPVEEYVADWKTYGRSAGPIRNRLMLKEGRPDRVIAFHDDLQNSKGTKDMVEVAAKAGVPVRIVTHADYA